MVSAVVRTPKLTDGQLYGLTRDLLRIAPEGRATIAYPADQSISLDDETKITKDLIESRDQLIQTLQFNFPGTVREYVAFHRGVVDEGTWTQNPNTNGLGKVVPSAHFDELGFLEPPRQQHYSNSPAPTPDKLSKDEIFAIVRLINKLSVQATFVGQGESATTLADIVAGQIGDLRNLHIEMTRGLVAAQKDAEKEYSNRRSLLENEISEKDSALRKREAELEIRREELNDREPQHERRRLREHLTERLQRSLLEPRVETSARERQSYYLYLLVAAIFISFSVGLAAFSDVRATMNDAAFWARSVKSLISGIAGAAFAWAGLSGLRAAAVAARQYEQAIQRYAFDMDRASWIVETILQMNATEETQVPTEWLESVCTDLFVIGEHKADESRSLEAFAALFDATAKARIGTNGLEFEIDKRGARKLAKVSD